jgi:uncharacterized protein YyaL (SSP411 family)
MGRARIIVIVSFAAAAAACARPAATAPVGSEASSSPESGRAKSGALTWGHLSAETFARARAERRIVLIDGSAQWCHWCRVMEATTYRDPEVRRLLAERFLPVKVDVDTRPDFEERYRAWGWPATVLLTPEAEEIGKYRGYVPPEKFLEILRAAASLVPTPAG